MFCSVLFLYLYQSHTYKWELRFVFHWVQYCCCVGVLYVKHVLDVVLVCYGLNMYLLDVVLVCYGLNMYWMLFWCVMCLTCTGCCFGVLWVKHVLDVVLVCYGLNMYWMLFWCVMG